MKKSSEYPVGTTLTVDGVDYTKISEATPVQGQAAGENCEVWHSNTAGDTNEYTATEGFENGVTSPGFNTIA